jgi:hypothetical protein
LNVNQDGLQGTPRWFRPIDSRSATFPDGFILDVPVRGTAEDPAPYPRAALLLPERDVICGRVNFPFFSKRLLANSGGSRSR